MLKYLHEKTLPAEEARNFSIELSKRGESHYTSAIDEDGNITVKWGEVWTNEEDGTKATYKRHENTKR